MKKILLNRTYLLVAILVSFALASCLKDKGFENGEYQTVNGNTEGGKWVSLPLAANAINSLALEIKPGFNNVGTLIVSYDNVNPADKDIQVTIRVNNTLVTDYNTANSSTTGFNPLTILPANTYQGTTFTVTIPAGQRVSAPMPLPINTSLLSATTEYGIGFTIESVSDASIGIPTNLRNMVYKVVLKNKYDGIYTMSGHHNRDPYTFRYVQTMHMLTEGANSVVFYWPAANSEGHPIGISAGGVSWYGAAIRPVVVFDLNTNVVTDVYNKAGGTVITRFDGQTGANVSRYDPATKTMIVHWNYANNPLRAFFDTLKFEKPRP